MYTASVPPEPQSKYFGILMLVVGAGAVVWGMVRFGDYVTSASGPSGAPIASLIGGGFVLCLFGSVAWCRKSTRSESRRLSRILIAVGVATFCVALLGHAFVIYFAVAIPTVLLGIVVRLVPGIRTTP
jgi:hypothetical protein